MRKMNYECNKCGRKVHISSDVCDCQLGEYWVLLARMYRRKARDAEKRAARWLESAPATSLDVEYLRGTLGNAHRLDALTDDEFSVIENDIMPALQTALKHRQNKRRAK